MRLNFSSVCLLILFLPLPLLLSPSPSHPLHLSQDSVVLKIIPPSGEPMSLTLPPTTTITQVMAIVAEKRKLNPAHYNMALPPEDPKVHV